MALVRANEPEFPRRFSDVLDRFFNEVTDGGGFTPTVDLSETDKSYEIEANLPGLKKKDINLEVDGSTLRISGEKYREDKDKGKTYHLTETEYGYFERALEIPEDADMDNIEAKYNDGILTVSIPKSKEKQKGKQIDIK